MTLRISRISSSKPFRLLLAINSTKQHSSWSDSSYQYIQRAKIPSLHFQKSLPRLPIPLLEKTCSRYLRSLQPVTSAEELEETKTIVKDFEENQGKLLHELLVDEDRKNKHTSYICGPWFDMYLSSRVPIALNYNPFLAWRRDPNEKYNDQLVRAANLVTSSLRFRKSLNGNLLEPMVYHLNPAKSDSAFYRDVMRILPESISWYGSFLFKAYPLDMSQFKNLFNTSRIPQEGKDILHYEPNARHMVVLHKGNFYRFEVVTDNGDIISPQVVLANLSAIVNSSDAPATTPLGALTTMNRDEWSRVRNSAKSNNNAANFSDIDSAVMLLVLDEEKFSASDDNRIDLAHHFLHGPARNRWFDKSFSMIVTKCGNACINFEHSWGDGVAVLRYFNEIYKDSTENHHCHPEDGVRANLITIRKLDFNIDKPLEEAVQKATTSYDKKRSSLSLSVVEHEGVTKEFIKQQKLSPDAIFQLSFQLGFYKQQGFIPVTYESCSTSAFRHGRTETIRPATVQTKRTIEAICSGTARPGEIRLLIDQASKTHNQLTREASLGQGFDRHLFALRNIAIKNDQALHSLYESPVFHKNNKFTLSTSTLHGEAFIAGGFAPVIEDGFGIGYGMPEKNFGVLISAYKPHTNGEDLARCLKEGLDQIVEILQRCEPKQSK